MRTAVIVEVEELLFDTLDLRVRALCDALSHEGVTVTHAELLVVHGGVPANMALAMLPAARGLDAVGRSLVLRRTGDAMTDTIARGAVVFDPSVRDTIERLAVEHPMGVVTRAERGDAQRLLEQVGLDACVSVIRSLAELDESAQHSVWSDAFLRLHADRGVALAPDPLLQGAARAGLRVVPIGAGATVGRNGGSVPFARVDAAFIATRF